MANALDDSYGLAEAIEIEQVWRRVRGLCLGYCAEISPAHGDGGVRSIGEAYDDVRIGAAPNSNDLESLAAERVMRVGDGHQSRSGTGKRGSVL